MARQVAQRCREQARALTTEEVVAYALVEHERSDADRRIARQQEVALLVAEALRNREISG